MEQLQFVFMCDKIARRKCSKGLNPIDRELILRSQSGCRQATSDLLSRHTGLVYRCIKQYRITPDDREAVYNYGLEGLWEAVKRFDVQSGNSFATYAYFWIRQRITRDHFWQRAHCRGVKVVSLYTCGDGGGEDSLIETPIASESEAEQERSQAEFDQDFSSLLDEAGLDQRSKLAVRLRRDSLTLDEIGKRLKVTRERVRQILVRAVRKTRRVVEVRQSQIGRGVYNAVG